MAYSRSPGGALFGGSGGAECALDGPDSLVTDDGWLLGWLPGGEFSRVTISYARGTRGDAAVLARWSTIAYASTVRGEGSGLAVGGGEAETCPTTSYGSSSCGNLELGLAATEL